MPIVDLSTPGDGRDSATLDCDICIIGSGPAGSTIARELGGTALRVTLLESGGFERRDDADALNEIENVGHVRMPDQWSSRNRIVGGSSYTWGGRCAAFDAIDFEMRPWVQHSGWPIKLDDLHPYLERTAPYLGLVAGDGFSDDRFWSLAGKKVPKANPDPSKLLPFFWQFSRDGGSRYAFEYMRFGPRLTQNLASNITLVANATVLQILPVDSGRAVQSVAFVGPDGAQRTLAAGAVVVCAGGLENARILLASNTVTPNGLGNDRDTVGRYLMDHPRGAIGAFKIAGSEALQKRFGRYNAKGNLFRAGLRLSPEIQRSEGLLNCAAWLGEEVAEDDPLNAIKRIVLGKPELPDLVSVVGNAGIFVRGLNDYFVEGNGFPRKLEALNLDCMIEQIPDADSRVTLSDRRDRFGVPLSRVDWRVHPDEPRTMRRMAMLIAEQFAHMGLPEVQLADWVKEGGGFSDAFMDVGHPTGATRMSDNPARGVVDANCEVHGVEGLFVAGSSVFATAGHCNPTQMIVALALRLADHLKSRTTATKPAAVGAPMTSSPPKAKVLVTGATGRIGHVVVADLLERGYAVRATTSKDPSEISALNGAVEWRRFDFMLNNEYDALVEGCDGILHLAAEIGQMERMPRVNLDATRLLAEAAERAGVKAFCYTSTVAIYGSGLKRIMHEDGPALTVGEDIASEYWALPYVRAYGRTKLAGEHALREAAKKVRYVVLRPTVVIDIPEIIGIRDWSKFKRILGAHRHSHHIYVRDVSDAMIWFMERALGGAGTPGSLETYNLSEDEYPDPTHAAFMRKAFAASGDRRYRVPPVPGLADWLHDLLRFRTLPLRNPLWRMRFPSDRLRATGYRLRFGMDHAYKAALDELRKP